MKVSDTRPLPGYAEGMSLPDRPRYQRYGWYARDSRLEDIARRQRLAYVEIMGHEPPEFDNDEKRRQFTYNPRARDAKDILAACATV